MRNAILIRLPVLTLLLLSVFMHCAAPSLYAKHTYASLDPPHIEAGVILNESAPGAMDGAVGILVSIPGEEPYIVLLNGEVWIGGLVSGLEIVITGLAAGSYTVQLVEFAGTGSSNILEIIILQNVANDPADIYLGSVLAESAPDAMDGAMVVQFNSPPDHPPYDIVLNGDSYGSTSGDFIIAGLSEGPYTVQVVDANGVPSNTLNVIVPLNVPELRIANLRFEPIMYEIGPDYPDGTHAWITFDMLPGDNLEFLNLGIAVPANSVYWVIRNLPIPPLINVQTVSYRINVEDFDPLTPIYTCEYHVGPEWYSAPNFPASITIDLVPIPATYIVGSGSDEPAFSLGPIIIPPIIFPPPLPGNIDTLYRGCDVPNVDLDYGTFYPPGSSIPSDYSACGPAAAANSLHWLVQQHAELDHDTTSLRAKLDSLKKYMSLGLQNDADGVRFDSMVVGKLTLIDKLKLPIRVKYKTKHDSGNTGMPLASLDKKYGHVADNQGALGVHPDFDWYKQEMDDGEDVEVHVGWYGPPDSDGNRQRNGGHWLVATGYFACDAGQGVWLKDDADQSVTEPDSLRHEFYEWDTLAGGIPYLSGLTDSDGRVAIVESLVSESYDPNVTFIDISKFDWTYKPLIYVSGDMLEGFSFHAFLEYTLPDHPDFRFLNARIRNPANGMEDWIIKNVPLPPATFLRPQHYRMNLQSISGATLPSTIEMYFQVGDFYLDNTFTAQGLSILTGSPLEHYIPSGSFLTFHPLIPVIPPLILPPIPPIFPFPSEYRGCEVPNIDLDTMAHPGDPMIPGSSDWNACGPAAAANSLQWLDDQHPEIDIPIELRGILDSLKQMMKKQDADGVAWDTMVMAKLEFIDKYKLPIHVKYQTHRPRPQDQPVIPSPDPTYGHSAENETDPATSIPDFEWLMQEMEAGEDVEVFYGYYCDTTIIIPATDTTPEMPMTKRNRKYGHVINVTGYLQAGSLEGIAFKHDTDQRGPDDPDDNAGTIEEYAQWCLDSLNYPFLKELGNDSCHAYVENIISESYDPSVIFCPVKVCIPDDDGEGSMRDVLACSLPGASIMLGADIAGDTIRLTSGPLVIDRDVTIVTDPDLNIYILGESVDRVFEILPGVTVTFDGVRIICGEASDASCVMNEGTVIFRDTQFYNHDGMPGTESQIVNTGVVKIEGNTNLQID